MFPSLKRKRRAGMKTIMAMVPLALALQACSNTPYTADKDVAITNDSKTAAVVVSIESNSDLLDCMTFYWQRYDNEKEELTDEASGFIFIPGPQKNTIHMARCKSENTVGWSKDLKGPQYFTYEVRPGKYILSQYRTTTVQRVVFTTRLKSSSIFFEVKKGEVVYIGNYVLEGNDIYGKGIFGFDNNYYDHRSTKLRFGGRDDEAMSAFLAKRYPKLIDRVVFRQPMPFVYNSQ